MNKRTRKILFGILGLCALVFVAWGYQAIRSIDERTAILFGQGSIQGDQFVVKSDPTHATSTVTSATSPPGKISKTAVLAGGCFWCVEADFEKLAGVTSAVSGYMGGTGDMPTYEDSSARGFREVVLVTYDPTRVDFAGLVLYLIKHSDATDGQGSFYDRGSAYASAVYFETPEENAVAQRVIAEIDAKKVYTKPLELVVAPRQTFWPAEEYHQDYYKKNPIRYAYYRRGSGRDAFIEKHWGTDTGVPAPAASLGATREPTTPVKAGTAGTYPWILYIKPSGQALHTLLTPLQYTVTQKDGTEKPFDNIYDKNKQEGIYVDILSSEPLYSSSDKYDSGTGWPSFVKPITPDAVVLRTDSGFFTTRTEVRSRYADSHLGHVFPDGPADRGGQRYCMNSAALRFVPKADMIAAGYGDYIQYIK